MSIICWVAPNLPNCTHRSRQKLALVMSSRGLGESITNTILKSNPHQECWWRFASSILSSPSERGNYCYELNCTHKSRQKTRFRIFRFKIFKITNTSCLCWWQVLPIPLSEGEDRNLFELLRKLKFLGEGWIAKIWIVFVCLKPIPSSARGEGIRLCTCA